MLNDLFDFIIPRFVTTNMAVIIDDEGFTRIVCAEEFLDEELEYDMIVSMRYFTFMGWGFFPKIVKEA